MAISFEALSNKFKKAKVELSNEFQEAKAGLIDFTVKATVGAIAIAVVGTVGLGIKEGFGAIAVAKYESHCFDSNRTVRASAHNHLLDYNGEGCPASKTKVAKGLTLQ